VTNDEAKAIGLRAMACKGWRWMPGVLLRHREYDNFRLRIGDERETPCMLGDLGPLSRAGWTVGSDGEPTGALLTWAHLWPDFRDPATLGCLLALVREAWGDPNLHTTGQFIHVCGMQWFMGNGFAYECGGPRVQSGSEIETLVAALEAA
jgi:hypothetical protein